MSKLKERFGLDHVVLVVGLQPTGLYGAFGVNRFDVDAVCVSGAASNIRIIDINAALAWHHEGTAIATDDEAAIDNSAVR